jgi:hypothetical protein
MNKCLIAGSVLRVKWQSEIKYDWLAGRSQCEPLVDFSFTMQIIPYHQSTGVLCRR